MELEELDAEEKTLRSSGFTVRAVAVGLLVGTLLCFTNMYFGLQTGWVTMGSIQCAVVGFLVFRWSPFDSLPFGPHENVVVQTVGVATATMPLAGGFVGIIPALEMLDPPVQLSWVEQLLWCAALAYFGIFFAVPLRRQTILVEKLRFPSGTATAKLIEVLHTSDGAEERRRWRALAVSFLASFALAFLAFLYPSASKWPVFSWLGLKGLTDWHWTLRPSLSYVGQGMIMGPRAAFSMLGGALTAWGVLGPIALQSGWTATAEIDSWECGARGWLLWVSIGLMLAESLTSFVLTSLRGCGRGAGRRLRDTSLLLRPGSTTSSTGLAAPATASPEVSTATDSGSDSPEGKTDGGGGSGGGGGGGHTRGGRAGRDPLEVAPPWQLVPSRWWQWGLCASLILATGILSPLLRIPPWQLALSSVLSCLIAVLAVRALGQTDLNPVSGVGKLSQIFFALVAPGSVVVNVVAGGLAEAAAMQAGDLMQDLKTGHLLRASPRAQFYAQLVGSTASIFITVAAYQLYSTTYGVGTSSSIFTAPVAHVWKDMALLMQRGPSALPRTALVFAALFGLAGAALPVAEALGGEATAAWLPSGISFGVGMYITPDWTIPRVAGALVELVWRRRDPAGHGRHMLLVASGFVLGEGVMSILALVLKALAGGAHGAAAPRVAANISAATAVVRAGSCH